MIGEEEKNENSFLEQWRKGYVCYIKYGVHNINDFFEKIRNDQGDITRESF